METEKINRNAAIIKLVEFKITIYIKDTNALKAILIFGFKGYDNYTDSELQRELARIIDESVIWKII